MLGTRHPEVKRLRALLRDRSARDAERTFVLEGPNVIDGALDRGVALHAVYLGYGARAAFGRIVERVRDLDVPVVELKEGVLEKVGTTRTPQPVLAVAGHVTRPIARAPARRARPRRGRHRRPGQPRDSAAQRRGGRRGRRRVHVEFGRRAQPQDRTVVGRRAVRRDRGGGGRPDGGARDAGCRWSSPVRHRAPARR